jgi:hypothetical protein
VLNEIHAILTQTLGEHAPSYATVKNWVAQIKIDDFSTYVAPRPGRPKTENTPEIIDQIQELFLEDLSHTTGIIACILPATLLQLQETGDYLGCRPTCITWHTTFHPTGCVAEGNNLSKEGA